MWGPKRAAWMTPLRTYMDQGLVASLGTDASVVPYAPLWVFYHFVTRNTIVTMVGGKIVYQRQGFNLVSMAR